MEQFIIQARTDWIGKRYWVVVVGNEELREFWEADGDSDETAYGWADANGYEYGGMVTV